MRKGIQERFGLQMLIILATVVLGTVVGGALKRGMDSDKEDINELRKHHVALERDFNSHAQKHGHPEDVVSLIQDVMEKLDEMPTMRDLESIEKAISIRIDAIESDVDDLKKANDTLSRRLSEMRTNN